jgi:hypothetical protein
MCYIKPEVGSDGQVKSIAKSGECATDACGNELNGNAASSYREENYMKHRKITNN